jgi:hypothetical protein
MEVIIFSRKVEDKLQDHEGRDLWPFGIAILISAILKITFLNIVFLKSSLFKIV